VKVLHVASEVDPWSKTGGLADVAGALPTAEEAAGSGITAAVVTPLYRATRRVAESRGFGLVDTGLAGEVDVGGRRLRVRIWRGEAPGAPRTFLNECPELYDRDGLYADAANRSHGDNAVRFGALCRAALDAGPQLLDGAPDVVHAHDWQAALALVHLQHTHRGALPRTRGVLTIHNLAYQGRFGRDVLATLGLPELLYHLDGMELFGGVSLLKGGIACAEAVTTVSPSYADEICTPAHGEGLDGFLRHHQGKLLGILNGIDTGSWDPAVDPALAAPFDVADASGKAACRRALLAELGLEAAPHEPVVGLVSRFATSKGVDLVADLVPELHALGARLVVLGAGDPALEDRMRWLDTTFSHHLRVRTGFDPGFARRIYAGADILLVPSRSEPCGLVQMYAMRYGAVPVAHAVGGLRDTVLDPGDDALMRGEGTGFRYEHPTAHGLWWALSRAVRCFRERPDGWDALRRAVLRRDHGWETSAARYLELYESLVQRP
jgi:starch synthase